MSDKVYEAFLKELATRRAPALAEAEKLLAQGKYTEARQLVRKYDDSIYGSVATAKLFEKYLGELVAANAPAETIDTSFREAVLAWRYAYPEPHTEIEARNYDAGMDSDRGRLVKLVGRDPGDRA